MNIWLKRSSGKQSKMITLFLISNKKKSQMASHLANLHVRGVKLTTRKALKEDIPRIASLCKAAGLDENLTPRVERWFETTDLQFVLERDGDIIAYLCSSYVPTVKLQMLQGYASMSDCISPMIRGTIISFLIGFLVKLSSTPVAAQISDEDEFTQSLLRNHDFRIVDFDMEHDLCFMVREK
jgi:hypothetical protein